MIAWFVPSIYLLLYALLHSVLASQTFKTSVARYLPLTYYRLIYVLLSLILLLPLPFLPLPQGLLYRLPFPGIFYVPQAIGLLGFVWALQHTDLSEFLGWTQLKRRNAASSQTDENPVLVTTGPYRLCRHPLYFFASLALIAQPVVSKTYALITVWTVLYFWIGSYFEERRLIRQFGEAYLNYRTHTPRLIPIPKQKSPAA